MMERSYPPEPPVPPPELIEACFADECVLYAGAGLGARVGLPTWRDFVVGLLDWMIGMGKLEDSFAQSLRAAIDQGSIDSVADELVSLILAEPGREAFHQHLREIFWKPAEISDAHEVIRDIPFSAVLTTNFDNLLERTFEGKKAPVFTPEDPEPLLDAISRRRFFLLKLYGSLARENGVVLVAPAQYNEAIRGNRAFAQAMETLLFSRTLLFIGASLDGIDAYLQGILSPYTTPRRQHCALVGVSGQGWEVKASQLRRRYGIGVIPYDITHGHPQVLDFLERLRDEVAPRDGGTRSGEPLEAAAASQNAALKQVHLENLGPFESLTLDLHPGWNILLGDNGTGKSTILKSIALGIIGKDAEAFGQRLVSARKTSGQVTLQSERNTYRTVVLRKTDGVEIQSVPGRPLEAEGWLALGFPPLRTLGWNRPKAPEARVPGRPAPGDLLPLIQGDPDPRLDKLKQWIVNLDYWIKDEQSRTGSGGLYERLLQTFFQVLEKLLEGSTFKFLPINAQTYEVKVMTDDGELPIEAVSQGAASLMGWVGVLLQRLFEVYGAEDPTGQPALVLIDEIDAHLHPGWQRTLVEKLKDAFPKVQFIATTHSPLLVAGMEPDQVFRFARDENGKVVRLPVDEDMLRGRADQILTGGLFSLETTIDPITSQKMDRYRELLGKSSRETKEEEEFQELRKVLQARIPVPREKRAERQAQDLLEALLQEQVGDLFPEVQATVLERARNLFQSLQSEGEKAA